MQGIAYQDPASARHPDPIDGEGDVLFDIAGDGGIRCSTCTFRAFGTFVTFQAYGPAEACRSAFVVAVSDCRAFERRLSTRLPHSDIARLNVARGESCAVHDDTAALLVLAKRYCECSAGTFDITVQPALKLWDFQHRRVPSAEALAEAVHHIDWRGVHVSVREGQWFARLDDAQAEVDLGGIAKGWIADRLAERLEEPKWGLTAFSVNLGGNVLARGSKPDGSPWKVGIRDPKQPTSLLATVDARDCAVVTSGTYERCFVKDGRSFHHILDPRTGMPVQTDLASATVIAEDAIDAEGFSTTLLALGRHRALDFARREASIIDVILVEVDGRVSVASMV